MAAFTAASKIEQVVTQAYVAMGTTMATYGAQNIGAGNVPRIRQGFKACTILGIGYSFVAATFIMTVGKYMTYLFVSEDVDIIMSSVDIYLKCIGLFFIPLAIVNIYRNGIQGLGYGLLPMMAGVAELIGRGVVALIAAKERSYLGVCLASPAAWVLAGGLLIAMYYYIMNVHMKKMFGDYNQKFDYSQCALHRGSHSATLISQLQNVRKARQWLHPFLHRRAEMSFVLSLLPVYLQSTTVLDK